MFCICHKTGELTVIDCFYDTPEQKEKLASFIKKHSFRDSYFIRNFISTHPDEDHIKGIMELDKQYNIERFYSVYNCAKKDCETDSFKYYKILRDCRAGDYIRTGMRIQREVFDQTYDYGFDFLWPNITNKIYNNELDKANKGEAFNNISPIIFFRANNGTSFMWMGDLESDFTDQLDLADYIKWPHVDVLFAPHHGRNSGKLNNNILRKLSPRLIVIGQGSSDYLNYYGSYNTLTQNTTRDISFYCLSDRVDIYAENEASFKGIKANHWTL